MAGLRGVIVDIAPLRVSPDYRRLWGADLVASAAHEIVAVAVPFQVYVLTGSSLAVGLVGAADSCRCSWDRSPPGRSSTRMTDAG